MNKYRQLHMRCPNLDNLPSISLGAGYGIHTHIEGQEAIWERIIEQAFKSHFSFQDFLIPAGNYAPEYVYYVTKDGKEIATAMGTEHPAFPNEGWFRMVAAVPEAKGTGAGKLACLAVMHSLKARGYNSIVLSTDDHRLPAISMYLSLGFEPIIFDEEHGGRWNAVLAQIQQYKAAR